ncbi:MAG: rod shape-determining protein, partial [Clostridiales bacterium]|nr:rod shape-determining protein [Clostridiales bacterium]
AIIRYIRKKHNVLIGERTAEDLKINVGAAFRRSGDVRMDVRGQNLVTGLPGTISISSADMQEALKEPVTAIIETIHSVFEKTPPELAGDIIDRGMVMTGGSSMLFGLDKLIKHTTGIDAIIADNAISCVAVGTGRYIEYLAQRDRRR